DKAKDLATAVWSAESKILHPSVCEKALRKRDFVLGKNTCATYYHPQYSKCEAIVYVNAKPSCTSTLLSRIWTITTCLCVKNVSHNKITVRIGDPSLPGKVKHKFYSVDGAYTHPNCMKLDGRYNPENDLSLLLLSEPFFDSRYVYIAKLPHQLTYWTPDSTLNLDLASYTDLTDKATKLKDAVWHSVSQLLHPGICLKHLKGKNYIIGKTMCASYFHRTSDTECKLDIGAPLAFDYSLIGILVYKEKCGRDQGVGSFVNIPYHSEWIRETVHKHTSWIHL
ncbi:hypothetical protein ILUMI_09674, partial [Ignelater luminosus]